MAASELADGQPVSLQFRDGTRDAVIGATAEPGTPSPTPRKPKRERGGPELENDAAQESLF